MLTEATEIIQILLLSNITIQVNHDKIILYAIVFFFAIKTNLSKEKLVKISKYLNLKISRLWYFLTLVCYLKSML